MVEFVEDYGLKGSNVVGRWQRETHMAVGRVENKVFPLVLYIITLETKEQSQPIEEVHGSKPWVAWRLSELTGNGVETWQQGGVG
ncbi:hypothetical protein GOBAR_DD30438 [Gossypium barbadense]|nr:hypothetical protein GOBAR_DD30438 [Gossypium barbadense]